MATGEAKIQFSGIMDEMSEQFEIDEPDYGKRFFVRDGMTYREVTSPRKEPVMVLNKRSYVLKDADSFISYVKAHGKADEGIIFYTDKRLRMFFNEKNRADSVILPLAPSLELITFLGLAGVGKEFIQKDFVKAFEMFPEVAPDSAMIIGNAERLKLQTIIDFESSIDPDNHVFSYQETTGTQTARLPKKVIMTLPYFENGCLVRIEADIEIRKPKSADEKPVFALTDPKAARTRRDALKTEMDKIAAQLPGWMFIQGEDQQ